MSRAPFGRGLAPAGRWLAATALLAGLGACSSSADRSPVTVAAPAAVLSDAQRLVLWIGSYGSDLQLHTTTLSNDMADIADSADDLDLNGVIEGCAALRRDTVAIRRAEPSQSRNVPDEWIDLLDAADDAATDCLAGDLDGSTADMARVNSATTRLTSRIDEVAHG